MTNTTKGATLVTFLFLICGVFASTASAQRGGDRNHRAGINQRQDRQQDRIAQGIKSGSLTAREAKRLESLEARFARQEARLRESGDGLSPKERAKLEEELNRLSRDIYRQKHDGQGQGQTTLIP